jgi:hypothetical protein
MSVSIKSIAIQCGLLVSASVFFAAPAAANGHYAGHGMHHDGSSGQTGVALNHTQLLRLPYAAASVVVGNPEIADVAVHSTDTLLILGRSYGSTNVIAMDASGRVIINQNILVGAQDRAGRVRIFEGAASRKTFDCSHGCLPSPELGDEAGFYASGRPGTQVINNPIAGPATGNFSPSSSSLSAPAPSAATPGPSGIGGPSGSLDQSGGFSGGPGPSSPPF